MAAKILVVDDDANVQRLLQYTLKQEGYDVVIASDGAEGFRLWGAEAPDLILLDVMLPGVDGFELCRQIRQSAVLARIPVIFLTARSDEVDRVLGLEIGGDDYMTKPFSPRELIARVKAHLRRGEMDADQPPVSIGPFRLERTARRVFLRERELDLTSTEFNLLEFFLGHPAKWRS